MFPSQSKRCTYFLRLNEIVSGVGGLCVQGLHVRSFILLAGFSLCVMFDWTYAQGAVTLSCVAWFHVLPLQHAARVNGYDSCSSLFDDAVWCRCCAHLSPEADSSLKFQVQ